MTKPNLILDDQKTVNKKVQLVFHKSKGTDIYLPKDVSRYTDRDFFQLFSVDTSEVVGWFENFTIDSIELWISSIIQTGYVTKLIVGGREEGGLRVILKPKTNHHTNSLDQVDDKFLSTDSQLTRKDSH